jgi:hypothetical protein
MTKFPQKDMKVSGAILGGVIGSCTGNPLYVILCGIVGAILFWFLFE